MLLETVSYARAGLLGNPSDGYFGKTIAFTFSDFSARVTMWESPEIEFVPSQVDDASFHSIDQLLDELNLYGYYGGIRLLKAATKKFVMYCREHDLKLPPRNFSVRYESNIPRLVGLGGSSAIVTAMFKALMRFYEIMIPQELLPVLCLEAETQELNLQAGLQDRVAQIYDGLMFMDFKEDLVMGRGYGIYDRLKPACLPKIYLAYDPQRAEVSGKYHQSLRVLFDQHDAQVVEAMAQFADFAQQGRRALENARIDEVAALINANFDLRDRIFNVSAENRRIVMTARKVGASAKFAGSGGTIVGTYADDAMFVALERELQALGCCLLKPDILDPADD